MLERFKEIHENANAEAECKKTKMNYTNNNRQYRKQIYNCARDPCILILLVFAL